MFTLSVGFVNGFATGVFIFMITALTRQGNMFVCFKSLFYSKEKKEEKQAFTEASSPEFNTCSPCHFPSASNDIGNYSALVWIEPGRLWVLLPCRWVSHSNGSKLAVTKAGLGSCCYASETISFHWLSARCQVNARQHSHYGCEKWRTDR